MPFIITETGDGSTKTFRCPAGPIGRTVTVNGSAATISSQDALGSVTLASAPAVGSKVEITCSDVSRLPIAPSPATNPLISQLFPAILLGAGTFNTSGQITLTTAFPSSMVGPTCKVYLFASNGLAAGWYTGVFSSTTVLQLTGNPTTTAGAYTPTLNAEVILATVSVPAGVLTATSGGLFVRANLRTMTSSGSTKTYGVRLGGTPVAFSSAGASTTGYAFSGEVTVRCRGTLQSQVTIGRSQWDTNAYAVFTTVSRDLSVSQPLEVYAMLTAGGDSIWFEYFEAHFV